MTNLPYFRWYPADAKADEKYATMTDQELGFYHRCLNHAWDNVGLPADLGELSRLMHVSRPYLDKLWAKIGKCFFERDGRLFNKRQERERDWAIRIGANNKRAGNANASRKKRDREKNVEQRAYDSDSCFKKQELIPNSLVEKTAERMYALHPRKRNKPLVETALMAIAEKATDPASKLAEIEACHKAWCTTEEWTESNARFAPKLDEWLTDEGFTRHPYRSEPIIHWRDTLPS